MSLICAVPSYAELSAATGQDVVVITGGVSATRLRLESVAPVMAGGSLFFRALLVGGAETVVPAGTHLSRVGDFLVRLRLTPVEAEDGSTAYEAHAEAHLDLLEQLEETGPRSLVAV